MGYLVLGVVSLVICFIAALEFSAIASKKGYDDAKYFWYPFLLGIIGMLIVIALPDRGDKYNVVSVNNNKKTLSIIRILRKRLISRTVTIKKTKKKKLK